MRDEMQDDATGTDEIVCELDQLLIDRMRAAVEAHREWNGEAERRDVLETLARARAEFARRAGDE